MKNRTQREDHIMDVLIECCDRNNLTLNRVVFTLSEEIDFWSFDGVVYIDGDISNKRLRHIIAAIDKQCQAVTG
jgi:hypothetical protein